jgi:hypothetical protein
LTEIQSDFIARTGLPLNEALIAIAFSVGARTLI